MDLNKVDLSDVKVLSELSGNGRELKSSMPVFQTVLKVGAARGVKTSDNDFSCRTWPKSSDGTFITDDMGYESL